MYPRLPRLTRNLRTQFLPFIITCVVQGPTRRTFRHTKESDGDLLVLLFLPPLSALGRLARLTAGNLLLRNSLALQEFALFDAALLHVDEEDKEQVAEQTQAKEKVEGAVVDKLCVVTSGVDDCAGHERANETGGLADDGEEAEEKELLATRCHFRNHLQEC